MSTTSSLLSRPASRHTLHVIYDPYCGWCYGAAPLVEAARQVEGLAIELHGGGMMAGNARRQVSPELRNFILPHIERITSLTGQEFGAGYHSLLNNNSAWLDSTPPTMAVVAAERFGRGLDYLDKMQREHFINGARINEARVLISLAVELGLDHEAFTAEFASLMHAPGTHIRESRELLTRVGGQGFPTFAMEVENAGDKLLEILPNAQYLGSPTEWRLILEQHVHANPSQR